MDDSSAKTILFVDDLPLLRELGSLFLARCGRVLTAASAEEALEICRRECPDLVLSDLQMPGMDGDDLCRAIKSDAKLASIPVVLLLRDEHASDRARAVRAGADDFLGKPMARLALTECVNRFLRFAHVRGLPRIEMAAPIELRLPSREVAGTIRNLSRGGLFVESSCSLAPDTEVSVHFVLPETSIELHPTAQVVWRREDEARPVCGMGLRFLEIDGGAVRSLDDYVFERSEVRGAATHGWTP